MKLGTFSTVFSRPTLSESLAAAAAAGLRCNQFDLSHAGIPDDASTLDDASARRIAAEHSKHGVAMTAVSGTFNMAHPDAAHRAEGLAMLRRLASQCNNLGTANITLCTGTRDTTSMWRKHAENGSPEAWRDLRQTMMETAKIGEEFGVNMAMEPEVSNVIDTARKARAMIDEIASPRLKICMDGANIFLLGQLPRMKAVLDEAFEVLGKDIVLAHAKDLDHDGDAGHRAAGEGLLDYAYYGECMRRVGFDGDVILHGLTEAQMPKSLAYVKEKLGVR